MTSGKGKITINGKDVNEYLPFPTLVMDLCQPLDVTNTRDKFDIEAEVNGGGFSGQTGAIRLGITKALLEYDSNTDPASDTSFRKVLKANGFITRDSRIKERKKPGLKKARRAPQFSKR
jgi:small subunit ribosomal protein S9